MGVLLSMQVSSTFVPAVWLPAFARASAASVLAALADELNSTGRRPVLFACFSGAAKACYVEVIAALDPSNIGSRPSNLLPAADLKLVKLCIAGQLLDSSPVDFTSESGVKLLSPSISQPTQSPTITPTNTISAIAAVAPAATTAHVNTTTASATPNTTTTTASATPTTATAAAAIVDVTTTTASATPNISFPATASLTHPHPLLHASSRVALNVAAGCLDFVLYEVFEHQREQLWARITEACTSWPTLLLYSWHGDELVNPHRLHALARATRTHNPHAIVMEHGWDNSPHVQHLRTHPTEYTAITQEFLAVAVSRWRSYNFPAQLHPPLESLSQSSPAVSAAEKRPTAPSEQNPIVYVRPGCQFAAAVASAAIAEPASSCMLHGPAGHGNVSEVFSCTKDGYNAFQHDVETFQRQVACHAALPGHPSPTKPHPQLRTNPTSGGEAPSEHGSGLSRPQLHVSAQGCVRPLSAAGFHVPAMMQQPWHLSTDQAEPGVRYSSKL